MRKLILILMTVAILSCTKTEDPEPLVITKFDSVIGAWTFDYKNISGEINIAEFDDQIVIDNVGRFTIDGKSYSITKRQVIYFTGEPGTINTFTLTQVDPEMDLYIFHGTINSSYTEMVFNYYAYSDKNFSPSVYKEFPNSKLIFKRR